MCEDEPFPTPSDMYEYDYINYHLDIHSGLGNALYTVIWTHETGSVSPCDLDTCLDIGPSKSNACRGQISAPSEIKVIIFTGIMRSRFKRSNKITGSELNYSAMNRKHHVRS